MKAVMLSIKPQWCEMIANGKKTVEVRKTKPKIETPFKCYIYCTKDKHGWFDFLKKERLDGKVIGEFVCKLITGLRANNGIQTYYNGTQGTCLTDKEIIAYAKGKMIYYWNISDLVIYDKPKELSNYVKPCIFGEESKRSCFTCDRSGYASDMHLYCFNTVTRPPQSWCYVEV